MCEKLMFPETRYWILRHDNSIAVLLWVRFILVFL